MRGFMHFCFAKLYLWRPKNATRGLNRPPGAENVKRKGGGWKFSRGFNPPTAPSTRSLNLKKVKADIALHGNPISELQDFTCHMGSHKSYLPPDTSEHAPPNPSHAGWYSIYLPRRDGKLSWPSWLDSAPVGSRTSDLSITSPTPNRCTTKTTENWI